MKTSKRLLAMLLLVAAIMSMSVVSAFASEPNPNTEDAPITSFKATVLGYNEMDNGDARRKYDRSSVYLYYTASTYSTVRVRALGATTRSSDDWENCTYVSPNIVTYVSCARGQQYSIHSLINEYNYSYAKLAFHSPYANPNYITGVWSADSSGFYEDATP